MRSTIDIQLLSSPPGAGAERDAPRGALIVGVPDFGRTTPERASCCPSISVAEGRTAVWPTIEKRAAPSHCEPVGRRLVFETCALTYPDRKRMTKDDRRGRDGRFG